MLKELELLIESLQESDQKRILTSSKNIVRMNTNRLLTVKLKNQFKCQVCATDEIQVHHVDYTKHYLVNFICFNCHSLHHKNGIELPEPIDLREYSTKKEKFSKVDRKIHPSREWLFDLIKGKNKECEIIWQGQGISQDGAFSLTRSVRMPSEKTAKILSSLLNFDPERFKEGHKEWLIETLEKELAEAKSIE